ncbi:MAG: hypothetical protein ABF649_12685 [Bacillus sp. (in: firmicutes)]
MSAYTEFIEEKAKLDALVSEGYRIFGIYENLSGALVEFGRLDNKELHSEEKKQIKILTADARKYLSGILIDQQREN